MEVDGPILLAQQTSPIHPQTLHRTPSLDALLLTAILTQDQTVVFQPMPFQLMLKFK